MAPREIVLLSFCSAKTKRAIQNARIKMRNYERRWAKKDKVIRLESDIAQFEWLFHHEQCPPEDKKSPKLFKVQVEKKTYCNIMYAGNDQDVWLDGDENDLFLFAEYLETLFQCHCQSLTVDFQEVKNMEKFIPNRITHSLKHLRIVGETVSLNHLPIIHDSLTSLETMVVNTRTTEGKINRRRKLFEKLIMVYYNAEWLTRSYMLRLDTVRIAAFTNTLLKTDDLIAFVKQWMNSDNTKLSFIRFSLKENPTIRWDVEAVKREFPLLHPWDPARRGRWLKRDEIPLKSCPNFCEYIDMGGGLDMERSDGLLATLYCNMTDFSMNVWQKRFHELPQHLRHMDTNNTEWN